MGKPRGLSGPAQIFEVGQLCGPRDPVLLWFVTPDFSGVDPQDGGQDEDSNIGSHFSFVSTLRVSLSKLYDCLMVNMNFPLLLYLSFSYLTGQTIFGVIILLLQ